MGACDARLGEMGLWVQAWECGFGQRIWGLGFGAQGWKRSRLGIEWVGLQKFRSKMLRKIETKWVFGR